MTGDDEDERPAASSPSETPPSTEPVVEPPAQTEEPPAQPPAGEEPPEEPAQPAQTLTAEELQAAQQQALQKRIDELQQWYGLSDEDAAELNDAPEKALPKLATRLHLAIENAVLSSVSAYVPSVIAQYHQGQEREREAIEAFHSVWPELRPYKQQIQQMGETYRKMNPKATREKAIDAVGRMVYAGLGMNPPEPKAPGVPPSPPASPPQTPRPAPRQPTFKPAMPSGGGPNPPVQETNPFVQIANEFLEEDQG